MKIKNNKIRNTGILFEAISKQITTDILSGKESHAVNILKKYFVNTELAKEYKIYSSFIKSKNLSESKAENLLTILLDTSKKINKRSLLSDKYNLIKELKEYYDVDSIFSQKIDNYKEYAALHNLLTLYNSDGFFDPIQLVKNKSTLVEHLIQPTKSFVKNNIEELEDFKTMDKGTKALTYRILIKKFNEKYVNLGESQKVILREFIHRITDAPELNKFINTHFNLVKAELLKLRPSVEDKSIQIKINEVTSLIKPIKRSISDEDVILLLQYYNLVDEIKNI